MRHHNRVHARCNRLLKRWQFDVLQVPEIDVHAGDAEMGIGVGLTMSGKVLGSGEHAAFMCASNVGRQ